MDKEIDCCAGKASFPLYEPDTLFSAQYFETYKRSAPLEPERELMLAVLQDAIRCFQDYLLARDRKRERLFREAEEWFNKQESDWLFSFETICEVLGLDSQYIRRGLISFFSLRSMTSGVLLRVA